MLRHNIKRIKKKKECVQKALLCHENLIKRSHLEPCDGLINETSHDVIIPYIFLNYLLYCRILWSSRFYFFVFLFPPPPVMFVSLFPPPPVMFCISSLHSGVDFSIIFVTLWRGEQLKLQRRDCSGKGLFLFWNNLWCPVGYNT